MYPSHEGIVSAAIKQQFVGRKDEKERIRAAVKSSQKVIYIEGKAGIGKTRLLEEANLFLQNIYPSIIVFPIIDFYYTSLHGAIFIEEFLVNALIDKDGSFEAFKKSLEEYSGGSQKEVEKVHETFINDFNIWVNNHRVILRFDTAELIGYGHEDPNVLEECEVEEVNPALKWILEYLPKLNNTTSIIASRPAANLHDKLRKSYQDSFEPLSLIQFTLDITIDYFKYSFLKAEIDNMTIERIWLLTDGRPILLSLAIDWLFRGINIQELFDRELNELKQLKEQNNEEWKKILDQFEKALIHHIRFLGNPLDKAVCYAARTRKGFNADILRLILNHFKDKEDDEVNEKDAETLMNHLKNLSFVKYPLGAKQDRFFLHDEMYDLIDRYLWELDYPEYSRQTEVAAFVSEKIYGNKDGKGLIADEFKKLKEFRSDLVKIRHNLDILYTEQLFYRLDANPSEGYKHYQILNTQAISQRNHELDDLLRLELLKFMSTLPDRARKYGLVTKINSEKGIVFAEHFNQDCRARWVHRFFARGEVEKAERVAVRLLEKYPNADKIWKARILVGLGAPLVQLGKSEAVERLQEAIKILNPLLNTEKNWLIPHFLGTAHLYLGLRMRDTGELLNAIEENKNAQKIFDENNEPVSVARAMNNLAYVMALRGNYTEAINNAKEAVIIRRELGDVVGTALSLNTWAIAENMADAPIRARAHAKEALNLLNKERAGRQSYDREIAMVYLNLGNILLYINRNESYRSVELTDKDWKESERHLVEALNRERSLDPYYQFRLSNRFGVLYTNWANTVAIRKSWDKNEYNTCMGWANFYFDKADKMAQKRGLKTEQADNLEDWAWVYHLRRAYHSVMNEKDDPIYFENKTLQLLEDAEKLILQQIDTSQKGLHAHYIAGSIYHQRGRFFHKFPDNELHKSPENIYAALRNYALSVCYYDLLGYDLPSGDMIGRRERVIRHIENTLTQLLPEDVTYYVDQMYKIVLEKNIPCAKLREWIEDTITSFTPFLKGKKNG